MKPRWEALQAIAGASFDVCIIGGGATGAGCAWGAQLRGLKTWSVLRGGAGLSDWIVTGRHDRVRDRSGSGLRPRMAHPIWPIAGKGCSDWSYALVPILGPLLGGVLAALVIKAAGLMG